MQLHTYEASGLDLLSVSLLLVSFYLHSPSSDVKLEDMMNRDGVSMFVSMVELLISVHHSPSTHILLCWCVGLTIFKPQYCVSAFCLFWGSTNVEAVSTVVSRR